MLSRKLGAAHVVRLRIWLFQADRCAATHNMPTGPSARDGRLCAKHRDLLDDRVVRSRQRSSVHGRTADQRQWADRQIKCDSRNTKVEDPMTTRVGINGFGRIGRQSLKALIERAPDVEVVAVNDLVDTEMNALLFKHDSTYGAYPGTVEVSGRRLIIDGREIKVLEERDPAQLPVGRPRRGHRPRVDRPLHRRREGPRAHRRRCQEGRSSARRPRARTSRSSSASTRTRTTRRATTSSPTPRARRTASRRWPRSSTTSSASSRGDEDDPLATPTTSASSTSRTRTCAAPERRPEHHPDDDRRGQGARARHPRAEGQVRRVQPARADARR